MKSHCLSLMVMLSAVVALSACGCASEALRPDTGLPPETVYLQADAAVITGAHYVGSRTILNDDRGEPQWMLALAHRQETVTVVWARRDGDRWSELREIPSPARPELDGLCAALDGSGSPVVVWAATMHEYSVDSSLFCARWTGDGFAVRPLKNRAYGSPTMCADSQGNVHLAFIGDIAMPEGYMHGYDGIFVHKCLHRVFSNGQWTETIATSGRGRYDVCEPQLVPDPDGGVQLTAVITPLNIFTRFGKMYRARQRWNGTRWSGWQAMKPPKK